MSVPSALLNFWNTDVPIDKWIDEATAWLEDHVQLDTVADYLETFIEGAQDGLIPIPFWLFLAVLTLLAWWRAGWRAGVFSFLALGLVQQMGLWEAFVNTLVIIVVAEVIIVAIGLPLGILSAQVKAVGAGLEPLLDFMQTMPAFVYLIPAVTFFGLGVVPGVFATVIFALPPLVRLTNVGLRQVPEDLVEACDSFGATTWQTLWGVKLPLAMPMIMTGVNQSIMMSLSMVVIAALIGAQGLGSIVIRGMNTLNIGQAFEAGLAIVIMATYLDRITRGKNPPHF